MHESQITSLYLRLTGTEKLPSVLSWVVQLCHLVDRTISDSSPDTKTPLSAKSFTVSPDETCLNADRLLTALRLKCLVRQLYAGAQGSFGFCHELSAQEGMPSHIALLGGRAGKSA